MRRTVRNTVVYGGAYHGQLCEASRSATRRRREDTVRVTAWGGLLGTEGIVLTSSSNESKVMSHCWVIYKSVCDHGSDDEYDIP